VKDSQSVYLFGKNTVSLSRVVTSIIAKVECSFFFTAKLHNSLYPVCSWVGPSLTT